MVPFSVGPKVFSVHIVLLALPLFVVSSKWHVQVPDETMGDEIPTYQAKF